MCIGSILSARVSIWCLLSYKFYGMMDFNTVFLLIWWRIGMSLRMLITFSRFHKFEPVQTVNLDHIRSIWIDLTRLNRFRFTNQIIKFKKYLTVISKNFHFCLFSPKNALMLIPSAHKYLIQVFFHNETFNRRYFTYLPWTTCIIKIFLYRFFIFTI